MSADAKKARLIVALDVDTWRTAKDLVDILYPRVKIFKVGFQLFVAHGPRAVEYIRKKGGDVFLDLKFHDIPNTVAAAVRSAAGLGVKMLTLHIGGGEDMIKAACAAAKDEAGRIKTERPLLIGVTVLTSQEATKEEVLGLANIGLNCGLDGVVCSVREAGFLRESINKEFLIVTPGIRPNGAPRDDQKRTATVDEAVSAGSDFLVVGRPIVAADDPVRAAGKFLR